MKNRLDKALAPLDPSKPRVLGQYFDPADATIEHERYAGIRKVLRTYDELADVS
jgi:hypothetical protein